MGKKSRAFAKFENIMENALLLGLRHNKLVRLRMILRVPIEVLVKDLLHRVLN